MGNSIFGIDLGTTNSAIAVYEHGEPRILKNTDGYETTPSVVYFTGTSTNGEDETLVGIQAKNCAAVEPLNVVQFVKRLMGNHGSAYNFVAPSGKEYTPEMISALILRKICNDAENYTGDETVKDVVITVPAYFDDARRTATKQAGRIANLNVLRVINEPTAAAIAFGINKDVPGKVLVYDLGGGTFDVTIMDINDGNFDVIATGGDSQLGGINFDQKLMGLLLRKLGDQGCVVDEDDDALMSEIREKAEKTKLQLSNVETSRPFFTINGATYKIEVSREEFEKECESLIERTRMLTEEVLVQKSLSWADINHLLVVGGSTRMPMVKKMLERVSGKTVTYKVDPDTAVAQGACIFASTLKEDVINPVTGAVIDANDVGLISRLNIRDVTSQSLGVITVDPNDHSKKINTIIIPHNTSIPVKKSEILYTVIDNQTEIKVDVTEGDDKDVEYVRIIGSSVLSMPPYPKDSPIEVVYAYDPDQVIFIEVIDRVTNMSLGTFEIDRRSNLSEREVEDAMSIIKHTSVD